MPVLRLIRERFARERPLEGVRIAAASTSRPRPPTWSGPSRPAVRRSRCPPPTRCPPRTMSRPRSSRATASATFARRGEDRDTYYAHLNAVADIDPHMTMDDGCDLVSLFHQERRAPAAGHLGRHRGDHDRRHPPQGDGGRQGAHLPGHRGQRGADQAPVRQPLRHRPVHRRRHPPRDQHAAGRAPLRRRRLRLGRPGHRDALRGHGCPGGGHRGRPGQGHRGPHGRLRGHGRGRRPPGGARCSSPRRATSTCSGASTSW